MAKILVADQLGLARKIVRRALERANHEVTEAENCEDALNLIGEVGFDFILTETRLPSLNGFELLKQLRIEGDNTPVIVITDDQRSSTRRRCVKLGAVQVLYKPIDATILNTEINLLIWSNYRVELPQLAGLQTEPSVAVTDYALECVQ